MTKISPGSRIGPYPYRIIKPLGNGYGNMAEVYLATVGDINNPPPESLVVIKISRAEEKNQAFFQDTIQNEAIRLRNLQGKGIVRILPLQTNNEMRQAVFEGRASALPGNPWFLVLEYLEGGSLRDLLTSHQKLEVKFSLEVIHSLAETLDQIHQLNQVHLDIKPENILFRNKLGSGAPVEPVLIDFGIARNIGQSGLEASTLIYAPPERVQQNRMPPETLPSPAPSMDVYSLGVVLYQMVTGRRPFDGRGVKHISTAIVQGNPTIPSTYSQSVSQELDDLILRILHKRSQQRPTAGELAEEVAQLLETFYHNEPDSIGPLPISVSKALPHHHRWRTVMRLVPLTSMRAAIILLLALVVGSQSVYGITTGTWWLLAPANMQEAPRQLTEFFNGHDLDAQTAAPIADTDTAINGESIIAAALTSANNGIRSISAATMAANGFSAESAGTMNAGQTILSTETTIVAPMATNPAALNPPATMQPTSTALPDRAIDINSQRVLVEEITKAAMSHQMPMPVTSISTHSTSTPIPDFTPTATMTLSPTPFPLPLSVAATQIPPAVGTDPEVTLVAPEDQASGKGRVEFHWNANFTLAPNQAFEPIFWHEGENPLLNGKGWGGTATGNSKLVDFTDVEPTNYLWGVLLVEETPVYKRLKFLSGSRRYAVHD